MAVATGAVAASGRHAHVAATAAYVEAPIRAFAIATAFWGVVGFLAGVVIALQLAFPLLNLDLECPHTIPARRIPCLA